MLYFVAYIIIWNLLYNNHIMCSNSFFVDF